MPLKAKGNHVLLEIVTRGEEYAKRYKSILIDSAALKQDEPNMGIVYAIGDGIPEERGYQVGDMVVFHTKEIFQGFEFDDKKLCSMLHEEILAKVTEDRDER